MQTLTIQVTDNNGLKALHALEQKHFIRILENSGTDSPALPGNVLNIDAFRSWINSADDSPTVTLQEAKAKWAAKRKQLGKTTK
jgi:hypothetical protein